MALGLRNMSEEAIRILKKLNPILQGTIPSNTGQNRMSCRAISTAQTPDIPGVPGGPGIPGHRAGFLPSPMKLFVEFSRPLQVSE
jgi:hypothetical protein